VLALPSAISPADTNFLLNPEHADFKRIRIAVPIDFDFDPRLLGR
jgi:RES domain-containing protein